MITKINKIKNLGLLFCDYTCTCELPAFKRFNLIYGWNASGKTTLSRLFNAIGGSQEEVSLEYEIVDDSGKEYKHGEPFPQKVRVFNQDYIKNNIKILEGQANSITILLGKENKELAEQIEADEILLNGDPKDTRKVGRLALLAEAKKEKKRKDNERGQIFSSIASTIGAAVGGQALRTYRKPQAEKDFVNLTVKNILSDQDLDSCSLSVKQSS
jgi:wobble nucleotide-excising tRNase